MYKRNAQMGEKRFYGRAGLLSFALYPDDLWGVRREAAETSLDARKTAISRRRHSFDTMSRSETVV
jgi:hypothetical protein